MLGKLLKHEFRATRRSVGMVILGSLLASAVGFGLLILCWHPSFLPALHGDAIETIRTILYIPLSVITFGVYALGFASSIITLIFILMRYYKNFFTDEGYLTFTLPVTPHELLWTKLISGMIWLSLVCHHLCGDSIALRCVLYQRRSLRRSGSCRGIFRDVQWARQILQRIYENLCGLSRCMVCDTALCA